ncbi:MAG TPA: aspartate kinase [Chitinophagaceae bacterium]|nr:aspartate kinase [Chitinophagaceae bacterium]
MQVFKFGGASVNSIERIRNVADILKQYQNEKLLVVISAMGKTTNALEKVVEAFYGGEKEKALSLFEQIKSDHLATSLALHGANDPETDHDTEQLKNLFTEVEWLLHDKPVRPFDYYYDQVVCIGELLSTSIISAYLNQSGVANQWIDVRDIFRTDDNFRDANIDWNYTQNKVNESVRPLFEKNNIIITQGFIGATDENESTTLGREGSDYSAAVFANMLDAKSQAIWKDVKGVMNADPKQFSDATYISELNYNEVIEMAFYGAQVIHPKTIKPLQNKGIPLYVKCFTDPTAAGTFIHDKNVNHLPPIIVLKNDQVLMHLNTRDFSFVGEKPISRLYELLAETRIKPNLLQTAAVNIMMCVDDKPEKIEKLSLSAAEIFDVQIEKGLTLLTIRHYSDELLQNMVKGKDILLRQQTPETVQILMK